MRETIFAAGTVCWRETKKGNIKVLLIRRVKHNDWSFPKGKIDKGESLPAAAQRETFEETGLDVRLGVNLGTINYKVGADQNKTVQYWAAKVPRQTAKNHLFVPNDEVFKIKWLRLEKVADRLTYAADRELFSVFEKLAAEKSHDTFSVILLRHAKALARNESTMPDAQRPLTETGVKQSHTIVNVIASFDPEKIISSDARRCLDTVTPLAERMQLPIEKASEISQETWESGDISGLRELMTQVIDQANPVVLCSHSPVLPDLTREIAATTVSAPGRYLSTASDLPPAAFSIFHIAKQNKERGIVAVETYPIKV